jgi:hypothetical protein
MLALALPLAVVLAASPTGTSTLNESSSLVDWYANALWVDGDGDGEIRPESNLERARAWYELPLCSGGGGTNITQTLYQPNPEETNETTTTGILTIFTYNKAHADGTTIDGAQEVTLDFQIVEQNTSAVVVPRQTIKLDLSTPDDCDAQGYNTSIPEEDRPNSKKFLCTSPPTPAPTPATASSRRRLRGKKKKKGVDDGSGASSGGVLSPSAGGPSRSARPGRTFSSYGTKGTKHFGTSMRMSRKRYPTGLRPTAYGSKGRRAAAPAMVWWYSTSGSVRPYLPRERIELEQYVSNASTYTEHELVDHTVTQAIVVSEREYRFRNPDQPDQTYDIPDVRDVSVSNYTRHDIMVGTGFALDKVSWPLTLTVFDDSQATCKTNSAGQIFAMIEYVDRWENANESSRLLTTLIIIGSLLVFGVLWYGYNMYAKSVEKKAQVEPE